MSYDKKCFDLAVAFISDCRISNQSRRENFEHELAQRIQNEIEMYLEEQHLPEQDLPYSGSMEQKI